MTIPPRRISCDITDPNRQVTGTRRYALYQGDTYRDDFQVVDENGDPVDTTGFNAAMDLREDVLDDAPDELATFTIDWVDRTTGQGTYVVQVPANCPPSVKFDLQLTNASNPSYAVGEKLTVIRATGVCVQQVTDG